MGGAVPNSVRPGAEARAAQLLCRPEYGARALAPGESAIDRFLIATHPTLQAKEQAELLGVKRQTVIFWRGRLYRRGVLRMDQRAGRPLVSDAERRAVAILYQEAGLTDARIAELHETSPGRVSRVRAVEAGLTRDDRALLWSQRDLAAMLGVSYHAVQDFTRRGWLPDRRIAAGAAGAYGWDRADVVALLRRREAWLALAPGLIEDAELAAILRREQARAGGRWHARGELAALLGIATSTLSLWSAAGLLGGLPAQSWGGVDAVWLSDAQARDLEAAAAPIRARAGQCSNYIRQATAQALPAIRQILGASERQSAAD